MNITETFVIVKTEAFGQTSPVCEIVSPEFQDYREAIEWADMEIIWCWNAVGYKCVTAESAHREIARLTWVTA